MRATEVDLDSRKLCTLASCLAPAYLRIGGTEADTLFYAMEESSGAHGECSIPPRGYRNVLTSHRWEEIGTFARRCGFRLMMTVNAGAGPRGRDGVWQDSQTRSLVRYSAARRIPVDVRELGNEVNGFRLIYGRHFRVGPRQYADDFRRFQAMLRSQAPGSRAAGPASAGRNTSGQALQTS